MRFEIHMYSAVAKAASGQRHPMLVFLRQAEHSEHDLAAAAAVVQNDGFTEVDITRAGTLPPEAHAQMDGAVRAACAAAVERGAGLMVFEAPVQPAPQK